jgi:rubredoxin-NAD+ reductase
MATQLKMQIATHNWVKEIHAEQQQLTLVKD